MKIRLEPTKHDSTSVEERHLIIFDRRPEPPWKKKVFTRKERQGEFRIGVWEM